MYYKLVLNPKSVRFLKWSFPLGLVIIPIAHFFDLLLPALILYLVLVFYHLLQSKSTLQFYEDKIILYTIIKKTVYSKESHKIRFGGWTSGSGEDTSSYYLMNIVSKPGFRLIKEIFMLMSEKDYIDACKKLTELKEI